jgi:hypothetical protein
MKEIYMEQTLLLMAQQQGMTNGPGIVEALFKIGTIKQTESGIKYLVIESKSEENGKESN